MAITQYFNHLLYLLDKQPTKIFFLRKKETKSGRATSQILKWNALCPTTESTYNSKLLRNFAMPCRLSLRSGRLTAIIWNFPAENSPISLRETSDNRDDMSRNYKLQLGKSWGMSAGNHNEDSKLSVLVFDMHNPASAERIKLPCTKLGKMFGKLF